MQEFSAIDEKCINTIRLLAVDMTFSANSGHPGAPMGLAPISHVLLSRFLKFNSAVPGWINRDRFVLSNGHACALQYSLNHLLGYNMSIDDLKAFRKVDSRCPGHPENMFDDLNIEVTTGPLGQGIAAAVGLAIAEKHLAATFNKNDYNVINNKVFCFAGDGCLMEGISSEASSLAGHLKLDNLIMIYDDNKISIDGSTELAFTEDVSKRYEAYGWNVLTVKDGDKALKDMNDALESAISQKGKPTMIRLMTTIGYGSMNQGTASVHGSPLKSDDIAAVKKAFGFDPSQSFYVPEEVYNFYAKVVELNKKNYEDWVKLFAKYEREYPELAFEFNRRYDKNLPDGWEKCLPTYSPKDKALATRQLSQLCLEKISAELPEFISGSADLTPSNLSRWSNAVDFQPLETGLGSYEGRYVRFGVREHAMVAILNGLSSYGMLIPSGGTFLNFTSYAAGSIRLAALSALRVILIATHDSIGLGEDGSTHQPIETLSHFRALPNLMVWRPADGNECSAAYIVAIKTLSKPSILALSRQSVPHLEGSSIEKAAKGGYVILDTANADITLVSTGTEVSLCLEAGELLDQDGIKIRVVSLPCFEVFDSQPQDYKLSVLPSGIPIMSVEPYATNGWAKYSHEQYGINEFGASGPYKDVYKKFKMTPEDIAQTAKGVVSFYADAKSQLRSPLEKAIQN